MRQRRAGLVAALLLLTTASLTQAQVWPREKAETWYAAQPWLVGSNYIPSTAINQLEMWQADTFDPKRIDEELGWAEGLGMNTMRVFLHDLPWQQNAEGFRHRLDQFLGLAQKHHIRPLLVLFDSCWDPAPALGKQRAPKPGVHNSGWLQSPGRKAIADAAEQPRLEAYVRGLVTAFASDERILGWDVWNEPDNLNDSSYADPKSKLDQVRALLPKVFEWARSGHPKQFLTSGVWKGDYSAPEKLDPIQKVQLDSSDVISFHSYDPADEFERRVGWLRRYGRPVICTEYMARPRGSTFQAILPIAKKQHVAAYNWGFVAGKSQTFLPWDSWEHPYVDRQPDVWFHDVFQADGQPYRAEEVQTIRDLTGRGR
jgi:Cellulase (glycosyl hydrolase family 5)